ncbi:Coproporphyrinogen-III oxidase, aerobic [Enhygromyxa salina]|uniref:coproporphyrinogen oxidase n=1 Tax=Enhygromyxa salina TaxID=215803 RepID=A0A2S9XJ65_9BACT|nr:oxygen-dependent coproporphyrinogen oxidase [Enhygromyxa salina]PRP92892.1 Coproporphyrinogen-III oxidase, aerobic [Enhygromyxa salina]
MTDPANAAFRGEVESYMRALQDEICSGLEAIEREHGSSASFREDLWQREGGGGGRSRVLSDGMVFEKGGVSFSQVDGEFSDEFAAKVPGSGKSFWASGVSLVLHPRNPHVPTVHANFRHLEHGDKAWFGGGADLTPYYFHAEDKLHFHQVWREVCEAHEGVGDYPAWSNWCDRYFYLPHRGERRGVGGLFFDYLWVSKDEPQRRERVFAFVRDAGRRFLDAYVPIVNRRVGTPSSPREREWQELRRGRYVEFNLVYDRGTLFGLKTGGRTESILMSLPPRVRWTYAHEPEPDSPEAELLRELRRPPPPGSGPTSRNDDD